MIRILQREYLGYGNDDNPWYWTVSVTDSNDPGDDSYMSESLFSGDVVAQGEASSLEAAELAADAFCSRAQEQSPLERAIEEDDLLDRAFYDNNVSIVGCPQEGFSWFVFDEDMNEIACSYRDYATPQQCLVEARAYL